MTFLNVFILFCGSDLYHSVFQVTYPFFCLCYSAIDFSFVVILLISVCLSFSSSAAAAKSLQSCLTLCDPIDGRPPGSSVPGILQARTLECVAISLGLVHWDDPEGWYGEGGRRRVQGGEHMYTCGGFILIFGKTNTIM